MNFSRSINCWWVILIGGGLSLGSTVGNDFLVSIKSVLAQVSDFSGNESEVVSKDVECLNDVNKNRVLNVHGVECKDCMNGSVDWSSEVGETRLNCCHVLVTLENILVDVDILGTGERRSCIVEVLDFVELFDVGIVLQFACLGEVEEFIALLEAGEPFFQAIVRFQSLDCRFR